MELAMLLFEINVSEGFDDEQNNISSEIHLCQYEMNMWYNSVFVT